MKKLLLILLLSLSSAAWAVDSGFRELVGQYGAASIHITNVPCLYEDIKDEYPTTAYVYNPSVGKAGGCYKRLTEDMIKIQWHGGDFSVLPANLFLQPKPDVPKVIKPPLLNIDI